MLLIVGLGFVLSGYLRQGRQFTALPRPRGSSRLIDDGPYRLVRHPMYGGIVMAAFGWALCTTSPMTLLFAFVTLGFFALKSRREEAWLVDRFPEYPAYRARTKRLIPWVY